MKVASKQSLASLGLVGLFLVGVTGCSESEGQGQARPSVATSDGRPGTPDVSLSLAKTYRSLAQVREDSLAVIIGVAQRSKIVGPADEKAVSSINAMTTGFRIEKVLSGDLKTGMDIEIRQLVLPGSTQSVDFTLAKDKTYALFVIPFTFGTGATPTSPDQYVVTGAQGAYEISSGNVSDPDAKASLLAGIDTELPRLSTVGEIARS